eukprot:CAMPEP_0179436544 /NCGR_PEP_ID=MMETSP0799-20121207/20522_1 /TAXON_ID=46947 /ORGANISM="Geminigera cryophila, Strain CCMP2564" /LENGTH=349 /DNA_ID=CAMNT_0021216757 /DNA_START=207 /DNA_END=1256 /DNA_ORIENTATION=+
MDDATGVRERVECITEDGCTLVLWRCVATAPTVQEQGRRHNIVLCHGLGSNRFTFDLSKDVSVAKFLVDRGWTTWLVDLRGSGSSKRCGDLSLKKTWNFDDHLKDVHAIISKVYEVSGNPVHFVGHSMGAMLLQCAASQEGLSHKLRSGTSIGGSLFLQESQWRSYLSLWPLVKHLPQVDAGCFQAAISPLSFRVNSFWDKFFFNQDNVDPKVARKMFRKNWESMPIPLLRQIKTAFKSPGLLSHDKSIIYAEKLGSISIPMLLIAGSCDLQTPPVGVAAIASKIPGCQYVCLGSHSESGKPRHYGHFDLIVGRHAKNDVWDRVNEFVEIHDHRPMTTRDAIESTTLEP